MGKNIYHYDYTKLFYEFSYALYTISWAAYRILRSVLPFSAELSLRTWFSPTINCIEKRLTALDGIDDTFLIKQEINNSQKFSVINCTLAIDAFSITTLAKGKINNYFLFLITPLDIRLWSFPVYLERAKNGSANNITIHNLKYIFQQQFRKLLDFGGVKTIPKIQKAYVTIIGVQKEI